MLKKLTKEYKLPVSLTDNSALLSYPAIFSLFMDMASEHALYLNLGMDTLSKDNLIWVSSKTKLKIHHRPRMLEDISIATWPEKPGNIRYNRYYTISDSNGLAVEGKSEWSILDLTTGRPRKSAEVYPADIEHLTDAVCEEPFERLSTDFENCKTQFDYTVSSRDIDVSQHMNNVAYIRVALSAFSCEEILAMNITSMEIAYRTQCFEGETLNIRVCEEESAFRIGFLKSDGKVATVFKISKGN